MIPLQLVTPDKKVSTCSELRILLAQYITGCPLVCPKLQHVWLYKSLERIKERVVKAITNS